MLAEGAPTRKWMISLLVLFLLPICTTNGSPPTNTHHLFELPGYHSFENPDQSNLRVIAISRKDFHNLPRRYFKYIKRAVVTGICGAGRSPFFGSESEEIWLLISEEDYEQLQRFNRKPFQYRSRTKFEVNLLRAPSEFGSPQLSSRLTQPVVVKAYEAFNRNYVTTRLELLTGRNFRELGPNSWTIDSTDEIVGELENENWVESITRQMLTPIQLNDAARVQVKTEAVQAINLPGPIIPASYQLSGRGVKIAIADAGIDVCHAEFDYPEQFYACATENSPCKEASDRTIAGMIPCPTNDRGDWHATAVASIASGRGDKNMDFDADPNTIDGYKLRGHAPGAQLGEFDSFIQNRRHTYEALTIYEADVVVHPYKMSLDSKYNLEAAQIDRLVRGSTNYLWGRIPPKPQVWSSGKESGYGEIAATAKNAIAVGFEPLNTNTSSLSDGPRGPAPHNRIKPDFVAPGYVESALSNGGYGLSGPGSSLTAPVVAGVIALILEKSREVGPKTILLPSTYKAILATTAVDISDPTPPLPYFEGPDYTTGFGRINAEQAVELTSNPDRWHESEFVRSGTADWCVKETGNVPTLPSGEHGIIVSLAWDDPATCLNAGWLVNDLDLSLIANFQRVRRPLVPLGLKQLNGKDQEYGPAREMIDRHNNIEFIKVVQTKSSSAPWVITVNAPIFLYGKQSYSIAASHPIERCD